jgi:hypothetical protein
MQIIFNKFNKILFIITVRFGSARGEVSVSKIVKYPLYHNMLYL